MDAGAKDKGEEVKQEEAQQSDVEAKLKGALEDRKLLRKHARRLEGEAQDAKKALDTKTKEAEALKAQLDSALEDRKLLRRHARQRDEAGTEAAREAARLKGENEELRREALRFQEKATSLEDELKEDRVLLERLNAEKEERVVKDAEDVKKRQEEEENAERDRRETLRESQVVVAALKEEVSRLRAALAEAETSVVAERARGDAARRAATAAAQAARTADDAVEKRVSAARCEAEAQFAADLRQRDDVIGEMHARQVKEVEDLRSQAASAVAAQRRIAEKERLARDATLAEAVASAAWRFQDVAEAGNASFLALSDSFVALVMHTDEEFQARASSASNTPSQQSAKKTKPVEDPPLSAVKGDVQKSEKKLAKSTHEWRQEMIRVTLLKADVGLDVDAFGRVTRVRGEALRAGVAFGDRVRSIATAPVDDFVDFASVLAKSARPVVLDLERKVLVEKDEEEPDASSVSGDTQEHAWRAVKTDQPCPSFGVDSPEVELLLRQWSNDKKKLQYVRLWFAVAADADGSNATAPAQFPRGLQLPALRHELLHGFLALVVPILKRARGDHAVDVKIRTSLVTAPSPAPSSANSLDLDAEPPTHRWDLALKVDIPQPAGDTTTAPSLPTGRGDVTAKTPPPKKGGGLFSRSSGAGKHKKKDDAADDDAEDKARREKINAQRRAAVEEKLAKMRLSASNF
eukprot:CAMPEP_0198653800 /NCGR_PEP_ID=MMETSP1467-20131203/7292_1 /TAXON_ID=1462469 /ORGANISM="unid. sp., Strain CCMP2135" /LENGTH=692 /DNA_ID=CAMNT_0044389773 /DNA_START=15 /DNA_END=2093 /DNA_ORIENTATION=+